MRCGAKTALRLSIRCPNGIPTTRQRRLNPKLLRPKVRIPASGIGTTTHLCARVAHRRFLHLSCWVSLLSRQLSRMTSTSLRRPKTRQHRHSPCRYRHTHSHTFVALMAVCTRKNVPLMVRRRTLKFTHTTYT